MKTNFKISQESDIRKTHFSFEEAVETAKKRKAKMLTVVDFAIIERLAVSNGTHTAEFNNCWMFKDGFMDEKGDVYDIDNGYYWTDQKKVVVWSDDGFRIEEPEEGCKYCLISKKG